MMKKFNKANINLTSVLSKIDQRISSDLEIINFYITYEAPRDTKVMLNLIYELNSENFNIIPIEPPYVDKFPTKLKHLDNMSMKKLESEVIDPDLPMYNDKDYINRRAELSKLNNSFKMGDEIKYLEYLQSEIETWQYIWDSLYLRYAKTYNNN